MSSNVYGDSDRKTTIDTAPATHASVSEPLSGQQMHGDNAHGRTGARVFDGGTDAHQGTGRHIIAQGRGSHQLDGCQCGDDEPESQSRIGGGKRRMTDQKYVHARKQRRHEARRGSDRLPVTHGLPTHDQPSPQQARRRDGCHRVEHAYPSGRVARCFGSPQVAPRHPLRQNTLCTGSGVQQILNSVDPSQQVEVKPGVGEKCGLKSPLGIFSG